MSLTVTFLGHAGFLLTDGAHTLAIDPFLTGTPQAVQQADDIACDFIALTHGHADHFGDTVALAKKHDATLIAAFEICNYAGGQGVQKIEPANPGGKVVTPFGWVALTQAFHSSSYEGEYMGMPCGVVAHMGGQTFYHCGDTCLFGDMRLLGEIYQPDVAAIPAGDRFTMGPELATKAAELIKPKIAIPVHWGTRPLLADNVDAFQPAGVEVKVMQAGESFSVG
ncbi:MAG: metal-dependent hydrolase [Phycisphaerales bacterium JB037]